MTGPWKTTCLTVTGTPLARRRRFPVMRSRSGRTITVAAAPGSRGSAPAGRLTSPSPATLTVTRSPPTRVTTAGSRLAMPMKLATNTDAGEW